jgi:hypothetical protein
MIACRVTRDISVLRLFVPGRFLSDVAKGDMLYFVRSIALSASS